MVKFTCSEPCGWLAEEAHGLMWPEDGGHYNHQGKNSFLERSVRLKIMIKVCILAAFAVQLSSRDHCEDVGKQDEMLSGCKSWRD